MLDGLTIIDLVGVVGSLTICAAYFSVSSGRMDAKRQPYQWMNLTGSVLLLISLYFRPNPGAILIEVLWAAIALWSLSRIFRNKAD